MKEFTVREVMVESALELYLKKLSDQGWEIISVFNKQQVNSITKEVMNVPVIVAQRDI